MLQSFSRLSAIDDAHPIARKLLLCPDMSVGREVLGAFARKRGTLVGWQVVTLRSLAQQFAWMALADRGLSVAGDAETGALIDLAFDAACIGNTLRPELVALASNTGTRQAIADAVLELRMAGVSHVTLASTPGLFARSLSQIISRYEQLLREQHKADAAAVFSLAIEHFAAEQSHVLDGAIVVGLDDWPTRGLPDALLRLLQPHSAFEWLHAPASSGEHEFTLRAPNVSFFHAASPADELLAVLRDVHARGATYDDVEIVCTDVDTYGVALDALCRRVGMRATLQEGIPIGTTRIGRIIERWLQWLESGFNAALLRQALEAGDFTSPDANGVLLARELRRLNVGWGLEPTFRAARSIRRRAEHDTGSADAAGDGKQNLHIRHARELTTLAARLETLVNSAPRVRQSADAVDPLVDSAAVYSSASMMLGLVHATSDAESKTIARVRDRLAAVAALPGRQLPGTQALELLRRTVTELRAWTDISATSRPRRSTGGHVHLGDLAHAGCTGRRLLYIVGLDAERTAGPVVQSSLLPDALRARFGGALATTEDRRRARTLQLYKAVGVAAENLTLSYATSGSDDRAAGPSHFLLEVWRVVNQQPAATYKQMRNALGVERTAVPLPDERPVDKRDLWLQQLQQPGNPALLMDALPLVRTLRPMTARALDANRIRTMAENATVYHGVIGSTPTLDIARDGVVVSASGLEVFAACPLRWFYRFGLRAYPPQDLVLDESRWLDPAQRGALLHAVYDRIITAGLHERGDDALPEARAMLHALASGKRNEVPPPSESVYAAELRTLEEEVQFFLVDEQSRWQEEPWELVRAEFEFGGDSPLSVTLEDGRTLLLRGRIDRVDRVSGGLRIVDYKTGRPFTDWSDKAPLGGGRRLQIGLYALAAEQALGQDVVRAEYRFPSSRAGGAVVGADRSALQDARAVVTKMVDEIVSGRFLPTFDKNDCNYCDYASACRTTPERFGGVNSPRAAWASKNVNLDEFAALRQWRGKA